MWIEENTRSLLSLLSLLILLSLLSAVALFIMLIRTPMSQSLPSLLFSFVFGVFYAVTSTITIPVAYLLSSSSRNDNMNDSDMGNFSEYETEDEYDDHDDPCLAKSIDPNTITPQKECPLFNGRIPPEIRTLIFHFALSEGDDKSRPYDEDSHYCRPGYRYQKKIYTSLLQTCKAVYMECWNLAPALNEHRFWLDRGPPGHYNYLWKVNKDLAECIKTVHFFVQMYNLDDTFQSILRYSNLRNEHVERVILTLRRGDWWYWEQERAMTVHPVAAEVSLSEMKSAWNVEDLCGGMKTAAEIRMEKMTEEEKSAYRRQLMHGMADDDDWDLKYRIGLRTFNDSSWGNSFTHLTRLKRLDIQFETAAYNKVQLDDIVKHALKWRFPFTQGKVLGDAKVTATETWVGPEALRADSGFPTQMPKGVQRDDMLMQTVTWTPVDVARER